MTLLHQEIFQGPETFLPITSRGVAYGDGIFTTAKIEAGEVKALNLHITRLTEGSEWLGLTFDSTLLTAHLQQLAKQFPLAVLKVLLTAGEGGRGYSRANASAEKILITVHEFPKHYFNWQKKGIWLGLAETKLGINPLLASKKHLNRLEQVFVRRELDARKEDDIVVLDINNNVVETSAGNIFWLPRGSKQWQTPSVVNAGVDGLVRQQLLSQIPTTIVEQCPIDLLDNAEAAFICNSVMELVPVSMWRDKPLTINAVQDVQEMVKL
ncbi:aminodeoxychorismate lyase [Thalassotalea euphylliae]|uniref:aminodeoxychorismate lyase n=1 Tax=Thalassotalea euphylliae TaxID=1655234 RepID=UPI0036447FA9